jgi:aryl-alcohol dehydrogenase-like predicted oxidoreductase
VKKYLNAHGQATLKALDDIAAHHSATPAQVALAWLMAQPTIAAPIASATSVEQLGDIMKAASLSLSAAELASLDAASGGLSAG